MYVRAYAIHAIPTKTTTILSSIWPFPIVPVRVKNNEAQRASMLYFLTCIIVEWLHGLLENVLVLRGTQKGKNMYPILMYVA
jgi:hypothetical protein